MYSGRPSPGTRDGYQWGPDSIDSGAPSESAPHDGGGEGRPGSGLGVGRVYAIPCTTRQYHVQTYNGASVCHHIFTKKVMTIGSMCVMKCMIFDGLYDANQCQKWTRLPLMIYNDVLCEWMYIRNKLPEDEGWNRIRCGSLNLKVTF